MNLIEELLRVKSCSVVGLEKNTGKTVCLNYILSHLPAGTRVAVTSIGLDGESQDQVTGTKKPEIFLRKGMIFATSEKHYRQRHLTSELLDVSEIPTALGRLVTARVLHEGKVMLSGPGATELMKQWMRSVASIADLTLVDGALSRMSLASPAVSQAMVLATGAAYSANIDTLVRKTAYVVELINLPLYCPVVNDEAVIEVKGAVTDRLLENILNDKENKGKRLVIQDFTKVFADQMVWHRFIQHIPVYARQRSHLLAVTVNPTAPNGMTLNSEVLCAKMSEAISLPVYDLMKE
ncbi:MAG: hypothetical protein MJZ82_02395 [Paludibacteraceae bacterium]|nr:hypothetical protein [Paludibacteraceae bacterium]